MLMIAALLPEIFSPVGFSAPVPRAEAKEFAQIL